MNMPRREFLKSGLRAGLVGGGVGLCWVLGSRETTGTGACPATCNDCALYARCRRPQRTGEVSRGGAEIAEGTG